MTSTGVNVRTFVRRKHAARLLLLFVNRSVVAGLVALAVIWVSCLIFMVYPALMLPYVVDGAAIAALVSLLAIAVASIFWRPSLLSTAQMLEVQAAQVKHPLISISVELHNTAENDLAGEVHRRAVEQLAFVKHIGADPVQRSAVIKRSGLFAVAVIALLMIRPELLAFWKMPLTLFSDNTMTVYPGSLRVATGADITLFGKPSSIAAAPSCRLQLRELSQGTVQSRLLRPDADGRFVWTVSCVAESFVYQFSTGAVASAPETVTVVPPPALSDLSVTLNPPTYTGLPIRRISDGQGDFSAYAGTRVAVTFFAPYLEDAAIVYGEDTVECAITGSSSTGNFSVTHTGDYRIVCKDSLGQRTDSAGIFSVFMIEDDAPQIRFLKPLTGKDIEPSAIETLVVVATDDIGIARCRLFWCKNGECGDTLGTRDLSPIKPLQVFERREVWNVNNMSLYAGDTLYFWAETHDVAAPRAHRVSSDTLFFRFPTFSEMHQKMAEREKRSESLIGNVKESQQEIMRKVEQLDKAASRPDERSWERQKLAEAIESDMKAQADTLAEALQALEETIEKLKNEGPLGDDLARKMDEIRKAVDELIKEFGDSLLFPKNNKGEISLDDMKDAVDKLKQILPDLSERLDNTLKFLESLKRDRELSQLAMQAEKLAREQASLAEDAIDKAAAEQEKELLDRVTSLQEQMKDKLTDDQPGDAGKQVQSLKDEISDQIKQAGAPQKNTMRQMSGALASLAQNLQEQTAAFRAEQSEILKSKLRTLAGDFVGMASWQETVRLQDAEDEKSRKQQAKDQQGINEALSLLRQGVDSLPMLPPILKRDLTSQIGAAGHSSRAAVEAMESGGASFGMQVSAHAMRMVAQRSLEILEALSSQDGSSCQGGGGMQESLRKMSGRQAAINSATSQLLRSLLEGGSALGGKSGKGGEDGMEGSAEEARKAAQTAQAALGEELKKLGEKFGNSSGVGMKKKLDDLEKEAKALSKMLSAPREEVTERQDRFLARMLQSALSMHREEEGKEDRKSTSAEELFTTVKGAVADSALHFRDRFYLMRKNALKYGNYPQVYRMSINSYFDSLGVRYLNLPVKNAVVPGE